MSFVSYNEMVKRLFKTMEDPKNAYNALMHAAIGVCGEIVELRKTTSHANFIEESGDIEFYLEAALLQLPQGMDDVITMYSSLEGQGNIGLVEAFDLLVDTSGDLLDIVKKSWVYQKECNWENVFDALVTLHALMSVVYKCFGVTKEEVRLVNQTKLIGPEGRFRSGFYSDQAAQERADKVTQGL